LEENIIPWENKKDACLILNTNYALNSPGDITWLRTEIANNLNFPVEIYSSKPDGWPKHLYKGVCESPLHHSHTSQLELINQYKYCICFESTYHSFWSQGFMTERMFNCFKVKTKPIYIGAYNVESMVPKKYFVDFRKYWLAGKSRDYDLLSKHLKEMKFENTAKEAYVWNKDCKIGLVSELKKLLKIF
jgi:hypothetical protein